jgi:hypothetical protein
MSDSPDSTPEAKPAITVSGVTFSADQVVSATVEIDGREIHISKKKEEPRTMGFTP